MPMHDLARVGFELGFPSSGDNSARLRLHRPTDLDAFCLPRRRLVSMNAAVTCVLARGVRWFPSPHRPTWYEIVRSTKRDRRVGFEGFLERAGHLLNRPYDPPSRRGNVSPLFRVPDSV